MVRTILAFAVVAMAASMAMAGQVYYDNYADGVNMAGFDPNVGWGATTLQDKGGYLGTTLEFTNYAQTASISIPTARQTLPSGYVWFVRAGLMSDVCTDNANYYQNMGMVMDIWDSTPSHPGSWTGGPSYFIGGGATVGDAQLSAMSYDNVPTEPLYRDPGNPPSNPYPYPGALDGLYGDVDVTTVNQNQLGTARTASWVFKPTSGGQTIIDTAGQAAVSTAYQHTVNTTDPFDPTWAAMAIHIPKPQMYQADTKVTMSHAYAVAMGLSDDSVRNVIWGAIDKSKVRQGWTSLEIGQAKAQDFNLDYAVDANDASLLLGSNWGDANGTMTMQQGDANGDGNVDIDDAIAMFGNFDVAGNTAQASAAYDPTTGKVKLTLGSGVKAWKISSLAYALTGDAANWSQAGSFHTDLDGKIGETSLDLIAVDGLDLGNVAATNLPSANGLSTDLTLTYSWEGGSAIVPVSVPEPATFSLLALGGLAMLRRRK